MTSELWDDFNDGLVLPDIEGGLNSNTMWDQHLHDDSAPIIDGNFSGDESTTSSYDSPVPSPGNNYDNMMIGDITSLLPTPAFTQNAGASMGQNDGEIIAVQTGAHINTSINDISYQKNHGSRQPPPRIQPNYGVKRKQQDDIHSRPVKRSKSKQQTQIPAEIAHVYISQEDLLNISSTAFEQRVKKLSMHRSFTLAESKEIKRQRRLVRNREYARASRQKKKADIKSLRARINTLEVENEALKKEVGMLNNKVKELQSTPFMNTGHSQAPVVNNGGISPFFDASKLSSIQINPFNFSAQGKVGVALFALLFMAVFYLPMSNLPGRNQLGQHSPRRILENSKLPVNDLYNGEISGPQSINTIIPDTPPACGPLRYGYVYCGIGDAEHYTAAA